MKMYDLIIIGSGPAGLSAAVYAQRARLDTLVIERNGMSGGQILNTCEVDNYPGLPNISGAELGMKLREHADQLGAVFVEDVVVETSLRDKVKKIVCEQETYYAKTVIIAAGAHHRKLGVKGEERLAGAGVSYCATCDGAFFRGKTVAVIGGGDVALEDAVFLARMCKKVYLIHRREELRGAKSLQAKLFSTNTVEVIWNTTVEEIGGEAKVDHLVLLNTRTKKTSLLSVDGVFVAVGMDPDSKEYAGEVDLDEKGYIIAGEDGAASAAGVYAAGDIRTKSLRQIITAAADGAVCVTSVERYLAELDEEDFAGNE